MTDVPDVLKSTAVLPRLISYMTGSGFIYSAVRYPCSVTTLQRHHDVTLLWIQPSKFIPDAFSVCSSVNILMYCSTSFAINFM